MSNFYSKATRLIANFRFLYKFVEEEIIKG